MLQAREKKLLAAIQDHDVDAFADAYLSPLYAEDLDSRVIDAEFYGAIWVMTLDPERWDLLDILRTAMVRHKHEMMDCIAATIPRDCFASDFGLIWHITSPCEQCVASCVRAIDSLYLMPCFVRCLRGPRPNTRLLSAFLRTGQGRRAWLEGPRRGYHLYHGNAKMVLNRAKTVAKDLLFRFGVTDVNQMASLQVLAVRSLHRR